MSACTLAGVYLNSMQLQSCTRMKLFVLIITLISCADHCCGERAFIPECGKPPFILYTCV